MMQFRYISAWHAFSCSATQAEARQTEATQAEATQTESPAG
jgi:hypothetical protein